MLPKRFTKFLLELHDILSNESGLVDRVEFFQEGLEKSSYDVIESTAKLYSHFLARSLRAKGTKRNLITRLLTGVFSS